MSGRPALPCPPWCTVRHGDDEFSATSHQVHRDFGGSPRQGWVTLYMNDYGPSEALASFNGQVSVHVTWDATDKSIIRELAEAGQLAELAEAFGRPDIAALIRELAALAAAEQAQGTCPEEGCHRTQEPCQGCQQEEARRLTAGGAR